jgi:hypothetical protein
MADAAILDLDLHVMRARVAPLEVEVVQRIVGAGGAIAFGWEHGMPFSFCDISKNQNPMEASWRFDRECKAAFAPVR